MNVKSNFPEKGGWGNLYLYIFITFIVYEILKRFRGSAKCRVEHILNKQKCIESVLNLLHYYFPYLLKSESSETLCESP